MCKGTKNVVFFFIIAVILLSFSYLSCGDEKKLSTYEKKLDSAEKLLLDSKTRPSGIKQLSSIVKYTKSKKHDVKFRTGCEALVILARILRSACGYEFIPKNAVSFKTGASGQSLKDRLAKDIEQDLKHFKEYSKISDWSYDLNNPEKYSNPQLAPFLELAYYQTLNNKQSENLKQAMKMLTYAESHSQGLDLAETLGEWGELLRELKEFERADAYLKKALEYGDKHFQPQKISETGKTVCPPGMGKWQKLKKRLKIIQFLLAFDLLEVEYGEAYAMYVKMRAYFDKGDWYMTYLQALKLKDKYPDSVYGEAARLYWCRMLLLNDEAGEFKDKSLPSGIKEMEKFIADKPYGLYRGEAWMELGKYFLEEKWDMKQASYYYQQALNWFREARKRKNLIDLYALPAKVQTVATPKAPGSRLNQWRLTEYRKPDTKEVINRETAPSWYLSENERDCLFMVGFFFHQEGKFEEARKYFEEIKVVDPNVAKLVGLHWPNVYWRLISACNVKRMIFPEEARKYLKGKNKLRVALAELNYICERFKEAKALYQELLDDPKSTKIEQAIAYIGIAKAVDMMPYENKNPRKTKETILDYYRKAIKLAGKTRVAAMATFYMGNLYLTVGWKGRDGKAMACFEKYLKQCPDGEFVEEAQFKQMTGYINIGKENKAHTLFKKYKYQEKHPESGYTKELLRLFKKKNISI
jgi:tetratricopeptide (TPR) repeat protein